MNDLPLTHFKRRGGHGWIAHCGQRLVLSVDAFTVDRKQVDCPICLRLLDRDRGVHAARIQVLKKTLDAKRWMREHKIRRLEQ